MVMSDNGMAATSHPLASKVAIQILEAGGNAVDAALAAAVLQGMCEPQMTGIGGDMFALIQPAGGEQIVGLNGSGRAPKGLDPERLRGQGHSAMPGGSAHAVTVPGAVDAICRLSKDHGRLSLADVLAPAIHYAQAGVAVAPRVAFDWAEAQGNLQGAARDMFLKDGRALSPGEMFRAPKLADTLQAIARDGRDGFYQGAIAESMVEFLRAAGGTHTLDDFDATASDYVQPISGSYKDYELVELPPNGQGAGAILLANILSHFDLASMDPRGTDRVHLEAEATKLAYDARNRFVGDPDASAPYLDRMLSPETAAGLAALIDPEAPAMDRVSEVTEAVHRETIYLCVVDRDRMAVSLIYSIFSSFGSGLADPDTGILFHDRGLGFNLTPGHVNEAGPGKRPMHTIIPAMLRKGGRLLMPFGVMGGQYQSAGHVRFMSNMVDFGMDPQTAIDFPRSFPDKGQLRVERGYTDAQRQDLAARGHDVIVPDTPIGGAQAILIDPETGTLMGASDPRKDGCALGY